MKEFNRVFDRAAIDQHEEMIFVECDQEQERIIERIEGLLTGASHWVILTYDIVLDKVGQQLFERRNYCVIAVQAVLAAREDLWWGQYGVIREQTPEEAMRHAINIMAAPDPENQFWMAYVQNTAPRRSHQVFSAQTSLP